MLVAARARRRRGCPAREPSHEPCPPASVVRAACSSQVDVAGWNRKVKNTTDATPASRTAVDQPVGGRDVEAIGFSSSRCLPAAAARSASGDLDVRAAAAIATASTWASSASTSS